MTLAFNRLSKFANGEAGYTATSHLRRDIQQLLEDYGSLMKALCGVVQQVDNPGNTSRTMGAFRMGVAMQTARGMCRE